MPVFLCGDFDYFGPYRRPADHGYTRDVPRRTFRDVLSGRSRFDKTVIGAQTLCLIVIVVFVVTGPELAAALSGSLAGLLALVTSSIRSVRNDARP